ncbi:MAG: hypothetical protein HXY34_07580 [Candidatus Thorarchaeota archaeon]|nr:hypothetical protein [Candidatus Thorarchaeota archaeon]
MRKADTLTIVALLVTSVATGALMVSAQSSEPFVTVGWREVNQFTEFEHTNENSQWIFGPQPVTVAYYEANNTDISQNKYRLEVGTEFIVNITIPKSFLGPDVGLEAVVFWGKGVLPRSPVFAVSYNVTADKWESFAFRYTPGSEEPVASDFMHLDVAESSYGEGVQDHQVSFHITYSLSVGPRILMTGMQAVDTLNRPSSPSWLAAVGRGFETPPLGLETDVDPRSFGLTEYYYAEVTDLSGNLLHHVGFWDEFVFHIRANVEFGEVVIPFSYITMNESYFRDYIIHLPVNPYSLSTSWTTLTELPPFLVFIYDGGVPEVAAGFLDNVSWHWSIDAQMWYPSFDILINETIDISDYYVLTGTEVLNGGASVSWTGCYTDKTDMNPDPLSVGATIRPDPFFWRVEDMKDQALVPRPEIVSHSTVLLAFMDRFIEGYVKRDGVIVHRVEQGDILNVTLEIYGPGALINGTTYIPFNMTHSGYDWAGLYVHIRRDNVTLWVEGQSRGENATHYWLKLYHYNMTLFYESQTFDSSVSVTTITYDKATHGEVAWTTEYHNDWLTLHDAGLVVGAQHSTAWFVLTFEDEAPDMVFSSAHLISGFHALGQWNVSLEGQNNWVLYPVIGPSYNWDDNSSSVVETLDGRVLWTPNRFILGGLDPWEPEAWTVTDDGAIDLDGNEFTTEDQYFVMRTGYWKDWGNTSVEGMIVSYVLDPSPGNNGDEYHASNWMGVVEMTIEFEANETFHWYHASDFTPVNNSELASIRTLMWANETAGIPNPGYRYVAWTTTSRVLDLTPLTGLDSNVWTNTWFAWGTEQTYRVAISETSTTWAMFRAKYAGLLLFNDTLEDGADSAPDFAIVDGHVVTEEVTHLVLIDSVDSIVLRKPFGATNQTGLVQVTPDTPVEFGISIVGVNVTIYPLRVEHSEGLRGAWDFRESFEGALGLNPELFDYAVTHARVTQMSFDIRFTTDMVQYDPDDPTRWNHAVSCKIDQTFGNWTLEEFDNSVLEDRSLAVNFFGVLATGTRSQYTANGTVVTDPNSASLNASYYTFGAADMPYAEVRMGGLPYTYGGDGHTTVYTSGSSTAPIGAFSLMYESSSGSTVTDWTIEASMLFMTAGYEHWGGHEILCDPVFISYPSAMQTSYTTTTGGTTTGTTGGNGAVILVAAIAIIVVLGCAAVRRKH